MALQFGTRFWPKMKDGVTQLGERYFNPIWELIDKRLADLEDLRADWIKTTEDLITFGLRRIDDFLGPAFSRVGRIAELGFLIGHSSTAETLVLDEVSTFVIDDPDERELFHPSAFVTIARTGNLTDFAIGQVTSYVRATGILDVTIRQIVGDPGPHADWEISTGSGVPLLMRQQLVDARAARDAAYAAMLKARDAVAAFGAQIALAGRSARRAASAADIAVTAATAASGSAGAAEAFKDQAETAAASVDAPAINARLLAVENGLTTKASAAQLDTVAAATRRVTARAAYLSGF